MVTQFLFKKSALSTLLLIILLFISTSSSSSYSSRRSFKKAQFGSTCNSTAKCDIHSLLSCEESTCQCLYPDAMTYSTEVGTCVSLVNEICGYLETKKVFINCVPNSLCDQHQGICKCVQGYVEFERQCVKQKGFGESCHSDSECLTDLSLICFEESCRCDPEQYVPLYSTERDSDPSSSPSSTSVKCVALAGHPCTAKTGCVLKASCISERENQGKFLSSTYGWMHPGICQCDSGYEPDGQEYCQGEYGSHCDVLANVTCSERFHCLDGICHCKYPDDQAYQENTGNCVSLVGGPCSSSPSPPSPSSRGNDGSETESLSTSGTASCGKFMECHNGSCVCKQGFVENKERGCDLSHGQPCAGGTMSNCDKAAGLHCVNGRCACKDDMRRFDIEAGKCLAKVGSSCSLSLSRSEDGCHHHHRFKQQEAWKKKDVDADCDKNGICQVSRSQLRGLTGRGVCMPRVPSFNEDVIEAEVETEGL